MDTRDGFICDRCGKASMAHAMSYFNTDDCCLDCLRKERAHPDYAKAKAAESAAVQAGNYNFPGIGKPSDL